MLIRGCEILGRGTLDVRLGEGRIREIGRDLPIRPGEPTLAAAGGALLPGLHDHHIHLLALAAARRSILCGPPEIRNSRALERALGNPPDLGSSQKGEWLRGFGYHESVAGALDRDRLDRLVSDRPLRIQHRSGALWMLNSAALSALGIDRVGLDDVEGIERDAHGRATGRLFRLDDWLRVRLERRTPLAPPPLSQVGRELARYGVTGVTDATPDETGGLARILEAALARGELRQRIQVMGTLDRECPGHLERGPRKLMLDERQLPSLEALTESIRNTHRSGRAVALHCVTRSEAVLALGALRDAGALHRSRSRAGDRIEHAALTPPEIARWIADLEVTVVTQPHFVSERGDDYRVDVEPRDREWLYRIRGLTEAGVALAAGSDAPFGHPDPWRSMRAAVERRSTSGVCLGPGEAVSPEQALALFSSTADNPGGPERRVEVGGAADLCLLDCPWAIARGTLSSEHVSRTFRKGEPIWSRAGCD